MRPYYQVRSPFDGKIDYAELYGSVVRFHWDKNDAQRACDDLNHAYYAKNNLAFAGTFHILERFENHGEFDDKDAKDILG